MIPPLSEMTLEQFSRQTYWYPILWYLLATGVAFVAAMLFWQKGSSTAEGQIPGVPVTWKFTGAGSIFIVVLLVFFLINPLKPFSDYKKIVILSSSEGQLPSHTEVRPYTLDRSTISLDDKSIPFDSATLTIQMIPADFIYNLTPALTDNSFGTAKPIPKGIYKIRFISSATGKSQEYQLEVK